jgi:hypothetical protein
MTDETSNLILEHLKALRADLQAVKSDLQAMKSDLRDIRARLLSLEKTFPTGMTIAFPNRAP